MDGDKRDKKRQAAAEFQERGGHRLQLGTHRQEAILYTEG
jgi:hypothetical protein